jgi:hypothetical protein
VKMKVSQPRDTAHRRSRHRVRGPMRRGLLALALLGGMGGSLLVVPGVAQAFQVTEAALAAECARLRAELERANAEISSLKRGDRGVRDDYRLRRRLADAEQLAKQLTASEAELRRLRGPAPTAPVPASPRLEPAEAPGVLEARADLLSDQARRLNQQAAGLARAATQLQTRQTLRRRAGQVERDPFGSMDGSKRFMIVRGANDTKASDPTRLTGAPTQTPTPTVGGAENATGSPPPTGAGSPGSAPAGLAPQPTPPQQPPPSGPTPPTGDSGGRTSTGGNFAGTGTPTSASELGARVMLDPATAAELRRLEAVAGAPASEAERLQRAASALARRAQALQAEASALRTRAQKR